ncbi:hypothetical protein [Prochlorococcus sp. ALOHA_ZT_50]|jgi:transcriptional regulator of heat shock response|uniref:hypothetical protein n=1 Tax=Prochlorococcus sp. ALOHA_ZT_50 TaxID=2919303 RepID=UPI00257AA763|nr:hypothetical protein [Prochlorococcus sp. ALOHA_ZT_50]MCH2079587.1 hypothetical protein [Prochlorococcus sp. ALOHA_ZT_50]
MNEEIKKPYISGLDDNNLSNLLRSWFKHERLTSVSEEDQKIIREELQEYANQLDESRMEVDNFMDGMLAMRPVIIDGSKVKEETLIKLKETGFEFKTTGINI